MCKNIRNLLVICIKYDALVYSERPCHTSFQSSNGPISPYTPPLFDSPALGPIITS